jgi:hypothetical protein
MMKVGEFEAVEMKVKVAWRTNWRGRGVQCKGGGRGLTCLIRMKTKMLMKRRRRIRLETGLDIYPQCGGQSH